MRCPQAARDSASAKGGHRWSNGRQLHRKIRILLVADTTLGVVPGAAPVTDAMDVEAPPITARGGEKRFAVSWVKNKVMDILADDVRAFDRPMAATRVTAEDESSLPRADEKNDGTFFRFGHASPNKKSRVRVCCRNGDFILSQNGKPVARIPAREGPAARNSSDGPRSPE